MAQVTQISFKMNVEVAPYRHEHAEVTVTLNPGDTAEDAFKLAKETARRGLGVDVTAEEIAAAKEVLRKAKRLPASSVKNDRRSRFGNDIGNEDMDPHGCI
jgi:hypothetical protein